MINCVNLSPDLRFYLGVFLSFQKSVKKIMEIQDLIVAVLCRWEYNYFKGNHFKNLVSIGDFS